MNRSVIVISPGHTVVLRILLETSIGDKAMKLAPDEAPVGSVGRAEISDNMREFQEYEEVYMYATDGRSSLWFTNGQQGPGS